MMFNNRCQFSVIEMTFVFLLFLFAVTFFVSKSNIAQVDYKYNVESFLDSIYYSEDYRDLFFDEDLSNIAITQDWSTFNDFVNNSFNNYEFVLSNNSVSKNIITCDGDYKYYSQRVISIKDNSNFEFRKIKLGVCY